MPFFLMFSVDMSNLNYCIDELDIKYIEYKYPEPTEAMMNVKAYVESIDPMEKTFTKKQVIEMIEKGIVDKAV